MTATLDADRPPFAPPPAAPLRHRVAQIGVVVALHLLGFGTLFLAVLPAHLSVGGKAFGTGLGLLAYGLGARHAFDADHIAGIDAAIRTLSARGRDGSTVGTWFSLGHSTVVAAMAALVAGGVRSAKVLVDDDSEVHGTLGEIGATASGVFLLVLAVLNLVLLWRLCRGGDERSPQGFALPLVAPLLKAVSRPWHIYPVGVLMGLGFDTATEVALLVMAADGSGSGLPWWAVMVLPTLFAAGMSLGDTGMGMVASRAYRWGQERDRRRFVLVVTALAAVSSLVIGLYQLASTYGESLGIGDALEAVDMEWVGVGLAAVLAALFVGAYVVNAVRPRGNDEPRGINGTHTALPVGPSAR